MNRTWFRITSWHAIREGTSRSLCGRLMPSDAERSDTLPADKSCESCLRIIARQGDV